MTLLIAYLLMYHMGITHPTAWIAVLVLWWAHLSYSKLNND
jgi:hypothetical protein